MRANFILGTALLMAGMAVGCSDDPATTTDSGTDSGSTVDTGGPVDSGSPTDSGTPTDRGNPTDSGSATDSGAPADAGSAVDSGAPADSGTPADSGSPADSGAPVATIHGCTAAMYVDRGGAGDTRTIAFGGIQGSSYSPKCMTVAVGQTVTFAGPFNSHPLRGGSVAGDPAGASSNPITNTDTGSDATFTFTSPGLYPYFCQFHQPGMAGVIQVR